MTVPSSGDRIRRGGRRPGWALLTVLLVLAIAASTALVFTNRVELLKLAVILSLWAAVVGAFVSVIYRRQSDADAAKARDLKLVYDLQLDREISARREYELNVETHLRRELASELRASSADEVAALRAELAALRTSLEILFDTDLAHRPAIETDRSYAEWTPPSQPPRPDRVTSSRVTEVAEDDDAQTAESPIIDVPEEPLVFPSHEQNPLDEPNYRGSHRRSSEDTGWTPPVRPEPETPRPPADLWIPHAAPPPQPAAGLWTPQPPPPQQPSARPAQPMPQPPSQPTPPPAGPPPQMAPPVTPAPPVVTPAPAAGPPPQMAPPAPGIPSPSNGTAPAATPRRGRHSSAGEQPPTPARHGTPPTPPAAQTPPPPAPRHRGEGAEDTSGGQTVADLLARLQQNGSTGGGRRRRRED
ncbi:MAG: hypothetical protein HYZ38_03360 [Mycobacterium sp.]|nr:hypothetical protein [Mycobacterium sp.]